MIKMRKILVGVDFIFHKNYNLEFDQTNMNLLKYGCEMAGQFNAELHVLHVVDAASEIETVDHRLEDASRKKLNELRVAPADSKIVVVKQIRKGRPFVEIIKYAKEELIDLIIIGTHKPNALSQLLIGSEAENIVRQAPCPVLVLRHPEHEFIMP